MTTHCSICGGDLVALGSLGAILWGRCRDCGADEAITETDDGDDDPIVHDDPMDPDDYGVPF